MKKQYKVRSRIWIDGKEGTFLGNGRIQLLELIYESGSINDAAKELKMSYRKAWSLLDSMNKEAPEPYILKSKGGSGGGGTNITEAGIKAIKMFKILDKKCQDYLRKEVDKISF